MEAYNVLSRIRHDGTVYEVGQVIHDITDEAAKLLIEAKAIAPQVKEQVKTDSAAAKKAAKALEEQAKVDEEAAKAAAATAAQQAEQDLKDAEAAGKAPAGPTANPVASSTPDPDKTSLLDKAKGILGGNKATDDATDNPPAPNSETNQPPASTDQPTPPTPEEVAATAAQVD